MVKIVWCVTVSYIATVMFKMTMTIPPIPILFLNHSSPEIAKITQSEFKICGCIIYTRRLQTKIIITVNDGSGQTNVILLNQSEENCYTWTGKSVRVIGTASQFRNEIQVKAKKFTFVPFIEEIAFLRDVEIFWTNQQSQANSSTKALQLSSLGRPKNPGIFQDLVDLTDSASSPCPCVCHDGQAICGPRAFGPEWPKIFCRFVQIAKTVLNKFPEADVQRGLGLKQRKGVLPLRCVTQCAVAFARAERDEVL
jgi:hypothetical protein